MTKAEAQEFIRERIERVRDDLETVEAILLQLLLTPEWRQELLEATDDFHRTVHGVIGLFDLSSTPAAQLQAEVPDVDEARWRDFDYEAE